MMMYGPAATSYIKSYNEADHFCKKKGQVLGSFADYCGEGVVFGGAKQEDEWAPTSDRYNSWVFVADNKNRTGCTKHEEVNNAGVFGDPAWGLDGTSKEAYEANYILCKPHDKVWYGPRFTADIESYDEAAYFCKKKGRVLGSFADYCSQGVVFDGAKPGSHWAPTSDRYNSWVFVGDNETVGVTRLPECQKHEEIIYDGFAIGDPEWGSDGTSKHAAEANYILCMTTVVEESYPPKDECADRRGEYKATQSKKEKSKTACSFDPYTWARGFVRADRTTCIAEELPGCDESCARSKCDGDFSVTKESYFNDGSNKNCLCTKYKTKQ
jgi:hypothetical protein